MKRLIPISLIVLVIVPVAYHYSLYEAWATGGAFPSTKHGGGTTDGETPCAEGVNRGLGADYGGDCTSAATTNAYHSGNPEAGRYKSGECGHCHEPHSMFGTTEPQPSSSGDAGPDPYLVFKEYGTAANYANLCWYCHQNIGNINSSGSQPTMGRWDFYQGQSVYQASSHYLSSNFYWPGTGGGAGEPWPRKDRSLLPNGNKGSCLNCHTPHGIKAPDAANAYDTTSPDGSGGVPATAQTTAANPSVMSNYMIPRQLISWEETLCERCHDGSPASTNIQGEINKRYPSPSATPASGHPVDDTGLAGRHVASEAIPVTTKHVECYDCHNPHAAKSPTGVLGDGDGGRVRGMKYVDINGTVQSPAAIGGTREPYVYEICLKCHGNTYSTFIPDVAWGTNTLRTTVARAGTNCAVNINPASSCTDGSNKRLEFDTATNSADGFGGTLAGNRAYHPVAAAGRNTSAALGNQLLGGLTTAKTINCTDCHNNNLTGDGTLSTYLTANDRFTPTYAGPVTQSSIRATDAAGSYTGASPVGPHGSTNVRVLRANYNTTLGTTSAAPFANWDPARFQLCFNCHDSRAFIDADGVVGGLAMTNFRQTAGMGCTSPKLNLHATHLTDVSGFGGWGFLGNMYTACANCHYNVHSNAEATNTEYGTATGAGLPADGDTHLVNFSPLVAPYSYAKPRWWYTGSIMRCNLSCHGVAMENGFGPSNADAWYNYYGS